MSAISLWLALLERDEAPAQVAVLVRFIQSSRNSPCKDCELWEGHSEQCILSNLPAAAKELVAETARLREALNFAYRELVNFKNELGEDEWPGGNAVINDIQGALSPEEP